MNKLLLILSIISFLHFPLLSQVSINSGLISHYPFDNGSLDDLTTSNNDWNLQISPTIVSDRNAFPSGAIDLYNPKSTTNRKSMPSIDVPNNIPTGTSARTISIWFNTDSIPLPGIQNFHFIYYQGGQTINSGFGLAIGNNRVALIGYINDLSSTALINTGQWHHLLGTFDGNIAQLYFDGSLLAQMQVGWNTSAGAMKLGHFNTSIASGGGGSVPRYNFNNQFFGAIDDLRIYNRVLNNQEIAVLSGTAPTSVSEITDKNLELKLAPNPASQKVTLKYSKPSGNSLIEIRDISGKIVLTKTVLAGTSSKVINIEHLKDGIYFIYFNKVVKKLFISK